jgi:hypothetical protein
MKFLNGMSVSYRENGLKYGDEGRNVADTVGRFIPHTESKSALVKPDSLIRGSLKERWTQVAEDDLSQENRQAIKAKLGEVAAKKA